ISFITNEHNQAHEYLLEGHQLAISCNLKEVLLENYSLWLVLLSKKNDVKHLTAFYQKYNVLREELNGIDMLTKIAAFEVDLEDQSNGETIEHQHQIMQFNEHLLNLHRTVYLAMIFIALLT